MLDLETKIDFSSLAFATDLLEDDPEDPKSLIELMYDVQGKFPFVAKAVLTAEKIPEEDLVLPVGDQVEVFLRHWSDQNRFSCFSSDLGSTVNVNGSVKRWVLVKGNK